MASFLGSPAVLPLPLLTKPQIACSQPPRSSSSLPPDQQQNPQSVSSQPTSIPPSSPTKPKPLKAAPTTTDSTDWIASSLTRRFGLGAGLAWVTFLAFGVISEQIKTRLEVSKQEANAKDVEKEEVVSLPNGIRYYEMRVGGGDSPKPGDLVVIDLKGRVVDSSSREAAPFVDTFEGKRPLALVMGSRPYTKGMCEGVEYVLRSMRAGGKRRVIVPPTLGFGDDGADLGSGVRIPPAATLEFVVQVDRVSIAPS